MDEKKISINRREAIKAMLAAGGALAASTLIPGKWTRPVVQSGYVPAHAQGTLPPLTVTVIEACRDLGTASLTYNDPAGMVTNSANVALYVQGSCNQTVYNGTLGGLSHSGDGYSGDFGLQFDLNCTGLMPQFCVQMTVGSRSDTHCLPMRMCREPA